MKTENKEVTLFSWEQFAIQADEIERRRKDAEEGYRKKLLSITNCSQQNKVTYFCEWPLRTAEDVLEPTQQNSANKMRIQTALPKNTIRESLTVESVFNTKWKLAWGLKTYTPEHMQDGWLLFISSASEWIYFLNPPVLLLPAPFAGSLN